MATTDQTRWKAIGCLFCTHTTTGHRAATLQRRLHAHLSAFSIPAIPFSHDTGSFWERTRHQPDLRAVGHTPPQSASGGGGGGGGRRPVNRVCVDEFHHVGIITALYSTAAKGGRAAALGTVSELRAYPWAAGLMEPVWSHEEIKAFVVRQFAKVAAMELLEELHILKHLGKTPIPSEWWEEKVMQAVALVTVSVRSPSRGVEVICINDFINDTLYQAHRLWYNHPRYSQFKTMGCFNSSKLEAFPGTARGAVVDTTKYPYVYGHKPPPAAAAAPARHPTPPAKARETTATPTRRPAPHKKCMLPEAEYGLDRYEDDDEPKYTPPRPRHQAARPVRKAPEMPTVFIAKKKRKVPPTARAEPGVKAEQARAVMQPAVKKEKITGEARVKVENGSRGLGARAGGGGGGGGVKCAAVFTGKSISPGSYGASGGGGVFAARSGWGAFCGQSASRGGERRGVGGLGLGLGLGLGVGVKGQDSAGGRTAVVVDVTSD